MFRRITMTLFALAGVSFCFAQGVTSIYPSAFDPNGGVRVISKKAWEKSKRAEALKFYSEHMYGVTPNTKVHSSYDITSEDKNALGGSATRRQVCVTFKANGMEHKMYILIYLPNKATKPVPIFVGLNFQGNYTTTTETGIDFVEGWVPKRSDNNVVDFKANPKDIGAAKHRWTYKEAIDRGYAVATIYSGDLYPDHINGYENSVCPMLYKGSRIPKEQQMKAIGAWAWGLSRAVDYFEKAKDIDAERVAVLGHSRLGKASVWAGAQDERFAMVISNNSGCGGASMYRYKEGERITRINTSFPFWFCDNFRAYNDREFALPVDQNVLLSLIAPRLLYVTSSETDQWADPLGEFTAAMLASEVYSTYGYNGLSGKQMPALDTPIFTDAIGYHIRTGDHNILLYDWTQFMNFADQHWKK